ncbi:MAG: methylmalonyl Co-A mutase-associated GTPase MeaB [Candidatus Marinimicrobia bacterium]|nr:methylmalonyl Co-A mutase-associated GTPase MeaB [Candidatus Neomarinimicrobiota bacterium]
MELVDRVLKGEIRAVAKAITLVENGHPDKEKFIDSIYSKCGNAVVWGVTGPPGAGKSTLVDKLIDQERSKGKKVAVIAVDPSSPFSGGAVLGDRLRMQSHATDPNVFIRSMASRGHLGGVAGNTTDAVRVLDAAGYDLIIIESIGVGQTEIEIIEVADIVLLVLVPGMGDEIQALKAGVMEIGDIYILNKKDHDGIEKLEAEVNYMLSLKGYDELKNPVVLTSAVENIGIVELTHTIEDYYSRLKTSNRLTHKRKKRVREEIQHLLISKIMTVINKNLETEKNIDHWAEKLISGEISPYSFFNQKIKNFLEESSENADTN